MSLAHRSVREGETDLLITGGAEATITSMGMAGFNAMRAMSTRNDQPEAASRPFDKGRDGFVMGEGAGILVFEELEHAKKRGARIYCEVLGSGQTAEVRALAVGQPDACGGVSDRPRHRMADPPGGVGGERRPARPVEPLRSPQQPEHPLLEQVEERDSRPPVPTGHADHERQVVCDKRRQGVAPPLGRLLQPPTLII